VTVQRPFHRTNSAAPPLRRVQASRPREQRIGRTRRRCEPHVEKRRADRARLVGSGTADGPLLLPATDIAATLPVLQPGGAHANAKEQVASLQSAIYPREIGAISAADRSDARRGCHQRPATTSPPVLNAPIFDSTVRDVTRPRPERPPLRVQRTAGSWSVQDVVPSKHFRVVTPNRAG